MDGKQKSQKEETFEGWFEKIEQLRKANDISGWRDAYHTFSQRYLLTPPIWLQWANDEKQQAQSSSENLLRVFEILSRSVQEALYSVDLWLTLLRECQELYHLKYFQESQVREKFEEALTEVALDYENGWKVFELYWNFEEECNNLSNKLNIQRRCAALPFEQYPQALLESGDEKILEFVEKNTREREKRERFERSIRELSLTGSQRVEELQLIAKTWKTYAEFEMEQDMMRAKVVYERAISFHHNIPELWIAYANFLLDHLSSCATLIVQKLKKAYLCVPQSLEIAVLTMRALEKAEQGFHSLSEIFWNAWSYLSYVPENVVLLSQHYLHALRRMFVKDALSREYFLEIINDFQKTFDNDALAVADPSCSVLRFIASCLELYLVEDLDKIRNVWEQMLRKQGKRSDIWLQYIQWEIHHQQHQNARRLFRRGIHTVVEEIEKLSSEWMEFEGLYGDLEQYDNAIKIIQTRKDFCKHRLESDDLQIHGEPPKRNSAYGHPKRTKIIKEERNFHEDDMLRTEENVFSKSQRRPWHDDRHTVFVQYLPKDITFELFESIFSSLPHFREARLVRDKNGVPKGFGYVEFDNESGVKEALKLNRSDVVGQTISVKRSKPPRGYTVSAPSRRIGIGKHGITMNDNTLDSVQGNEIEEQNTQVVSNNNMSPTTSNQSWTQDDFRKWIQQSSEQKKQ
eukprot:jgi/Galph1/5321/GphlegSOOS_G3904.1